MTEQEKNIIKNEILEQLKADSKLIEELTPVHSLKDDDLFEIDGGRYVSFKTLKKIGIDTDAIEDYFLSKRRNDRTAYDISVGGTLTSEFMMLFGKFMSGAFGGMIDAKGNMEMESGIFRSFLQIYELIVNRQRTIEGDVLLTEGDTIEEVIPLGVSDEGNLRFTLKLHPEWDGYTTAQYEGNVIRGIYNDITSRMPSGSPTKTENPDGTVTGEDGLTHINGATYFTSWMKVLEVRPTDNEIDVVMYPDEDCPAGKNFPPRAMMKFARWGNAGEQPEQLKRQSVLILSSTEGRILKHYRVTKPIIDEGNVAFCLGTVPDFVADLTSRIQRGDEAIYVRDIIAQRYIEIDHLGRPVAELVYRGEYDPNETYYDGTAPNPDGKYEKSYVLYYGCQWLCLNTGTKNPPSWDSTDWELFLGDPRLVIDLVADRNRLMRNNPKLRLAATVSINYQDITADPKVRWDWARKTVRNGVEDSASDAIWTAAHSNCGLSEITLVEADMNYSFGTPPDEITYIVTATLIDKAGKVMTYHKNPLTESLAIDISYKR